MASGERKGELNPNAVALGTKEEEDGWVLICLTQRENT